VDEWHRSRAQTARPPAGGHACGEGLILPPARRQQAPPGGRPQHGDDASADAGDGRAVTHG
jgi:hypothetical protein